MGVYIKGMGMPKSCGECKAFVCYRQWAGDSGDTFCGITKSDAKEKEKNADCPLVPVQKHGRLIDADKMRESIRKQTAFLRILGGEFAEIAETLEKGFLQEIDNAPTIIPAEEGET